MSFCSSPLMAAAAAAAASTAAPSPAAGPSSSSVTPGTSPVVLVTFPETIKYLEPHKAAWASRGVALVFAPYPAQKAECHAWLSSGRVQVLLSEPPLIGEAMALAPATAAAPLWCQSVYAGCEGIVATARALLAKHQPATATATATTTTTAATAPAVTVPSAASTALQHITVTRAGHVFGQTLSEYALTAILSRERKWPELSSAQAAKHWAKGTYTNRLLSTLSVGILGASGEIGRAFAKICKALGMTVYGYGRAPPTASASAGATGDSKAAAANANPDVDGWFYGTDVAAATPAGKALAGLPAIVSKSDYVVSILPHTPQTTGLLTADVLQHCKAGCVLINVGRGSLIAEDALLQALDQKWLHHAVLDVFAQEPLPSTSPLWTHPQLTITPHVAALSWVVGAEIGRLFEAQLTRFYGAGGGASKLEYRIDFERGY